ncbi:MAG: hypothetical protein ACE37F_27055 [Nannocystaceae bacterium]|nr:hypothetical protein [bacterium]
MRPPFVGHRRYSITHRAVQRLRELVPTRAEDDDETLRDRLDVALGEAEDGGRAIRTLDAMLGEPQTLIPVGEFGEVLYAIIKEDTVVTVLPKGHGEEILQRGQAMEQRVASGQVQVQPRPAERDRFEAGVRRRWHKEAPPVVVERVGRPAVDPRAAQAAPPLPATSAPLPAGTQPPPASNDASGLVFRLPEPPPSDSPVAGALRQALDEGRRRAAVLALREAIVAADEDDVLDALWTAVAQKGLPKTMTVGDLLEATAGARK